MPFIDCPFCDADIADITDACPACGGMLKTARIVGAEGMRVGLQKD
jgi:hypothetical protein